MKEIQYTFSDDDILIMLEALRSHHVLTESEMLTSYSDDEAREKSEAELARVDALSARIKRRYFEAVKGA